MSRKGLPIALHVPSLIEIFTRSSTNCTNIFILKLLYLRWQGTWRSWPWPDWLQPLRLQVLRGGVLREAGAGDQARPVSTREEFETFRTKKLFKEKSSVAAAEYSHLMSTDVHVTNCQVPVRYWAAIHAVCLIPTPPLAWCRLSSLEGTSSYHSFNSSQAIIPILVKIIAPSTLWPSVTSL